MMSGAFLMPLVLFTLKCWNLECIIDVERQGKDAPSKLRLEDLLNEEAGREGNNAGDAEEVTFID
jgi:hypothetical protein